MEAPEGCYGEQEVRDIWGRLKRIIRYRRLSADASIKEIPPAIEIREIPLDLAEILKHQKEHFVFPMFE